MGGRAEDGAGRAEGRRGLAAAARRSLAVTLMSLAVATVGGPSAGRAPAAGATPATGGDTPAPTADATPATGGDAPAGTGDGDGDGGALAMWIAGEVVILLGGASALRLWTDRRGRGGRAGARAGPRGACDMCAAGRPCPGSGAPGRGCDRPPIRIRL